MEDYYKNFDEDNRLSSRSGSVEYRTTMRYIERYLMPRARVIEIGAATGRYSHALAQMGYVVDAVELLEHNIELFKKNTQPNETVTITQGNALDLSDFPDCTYDITLLLGPLYHLYNDADKHKAISEAIRVTKPGGIVFAAWVMSDALLLEGGFRQQRWSVGRVIEQGYIDGETFANILTEPRHIIDVVRKEQIDSIMSEYSVTRLHFISAECCWLVGDALENMDEELFELYMKYHFATCERAAMAELSYHAIDIFKKG